jgi:hypothetical protein
MPFWDRSILDHVHKSWPFNTTQFNTAWKFIPQYLIIQSGVKVT